MLNVSLSTRQGLLGMLVIQWCVLCAALPTYSTSFVLTAPPFPVTKANVTSYLQALGVFVNASAVSMSNLL